MCVTFFCLKPSNNPKIKLIMGFNRDQNTQRDTLPLNPFKEDPNIYAGRDIISGGTWLGINIETGVLVILTNFDMEEIRMGRSRGQLVYRFLSSKFISPDKRGQTDAIIVQALEQLAKIAHQYSAFNLTVINLRTSNAYYICSQRPPQSNIPLKLEINKVHGICNSAIEEVWQKTALGIKMFKEFVNKLDDKSENQMLEGMEKIFKVRTRFSQDPEDESSIFVYPYFNKQLQAERRTKSTFYLIVKQRQQNLQLLMREVSYHGENMKESRVEHRVKMTK